MEIASAFESLSDSFKIPEVPNSSYVEVVAIIIVCMILLLLVIIGWRLYKEGRQSAFWKLIPLRSLMGGGQRCVICGSYEIPGCTMDSPRIMDGDSERARLLQNYRLALYQFQLEQKANQLKKA